MMTTNPLSEERKNVLELVAAGKISVAEAAQMIAGLEPGATEAPPPAAKSDAATKAVAPETEDEPARLKAKQANGRKPRWLHVQVSDPASGRTKVEVNLPLSFLNFGLRLGRHFAPELKDVNLEELAGAIDEVESGVLVNVNDEEDGEQVRIYLS
jgi:hypothetical protein